ncbi:hypothetical protein ABZT28_53660 [Streptomyces sp. NPDC005388]|uniref:hypothetical protein n=1 Tax=Streptomyces sp. NPDC005388 TaxID=3156717 RepID=UPI0033B47E71
MTTGPRRPTAPGLVLRRRSLLRGLKTTSASSWAPTLAAANCRDSPKLFQFEVAPALRREIPGPPFLWVPLLAEG